jgi:folylpolyglutamate synthase/dihydropteroate synthase
MDGAHNAQKMMAFVDSFVEKYPDKKAVILLSLKVGKEYDDVLPLLSPISDELIITEFEGMQDTPLHSMDVDELAEKAKQYIPDTVVIKNQNQAYERLLKSPHDLAVITGSFYLISQLRSTHKELKYA